MPIRQASAGVRTPRGLAPITSSFSNAAIALPDVLQSFAQHRKNGTLMINTAQGVQYLGLHAGNIVFITGTPPGSLLKSVVWTHHISAEQMTELAARQQQDDSACARELLDQDIVSSESLRDAISCLIEETFHAALRDQAPEWDLAVDDPVDDWVQLQRNIGVNLSINGMLMESMRRRDEFQAVADYLALDWDLPLRTNNTIEEQLTDPEQTLLLSLVDDVSSVYDVINRAHIIPSFAQLALANLLQRGYLRLADHREMVVVADACRAQGTVISAENFYRRAIELGCDLPRVRFQLGELLARRGENNEAAACFLQAGDALAQMSPKDAAVSLRNALKLGADPKLCLRRLALLHQQQGDKTEAAKVLWQLADHHEKAGELHDALVAVEEAAAQGVNPRQVLQRKGDLAQRTGDYPEALKLGMRSKI